METNGEDVRKRRMHRAREREIAIIFGKTSERAFGRVLELGAGDCFQSRFLRRFATELTCSDFHFDKLDRNDASIRYLQCDAEKVDRQFAGERFGLVFSSNMIQHTSDQHAVLSGVARVLADDGVAVFVMPGPCWKIFKLVLCYPLLVASLPARLWRKLKVRPPSDQQPTSPDFDNNSKFSLRRGRSRRQVEC